MNQRFIDHKKTRNLEPQDLLCLAPKRAIYFRVDGKVTACCYNTKDEYGRYPESSVSELWESVVRKQMEAEISRDDLPDGCYKCRRSIEAGNDGGTLAGRFDFLKDHPNNITGHELPTLMEFELGTNCNLECVMCNGWVSSAIRANRDKLPPLVNPWDKNFVTQVEPYLKNLRVANFLGGEPFLNDLNFDIWELLAQHNPTCRVNITTNGTILNDSIKSLLLRLRPNIVVSIESFDKNNYEHIRKNAKLSNVMTNIDWFLQHRLLGSLTVCVMEKNLQDIAEMLVFCNKNDIRLYFNTIFEPDELTLEKADPKNLNAQIAILSQFLSGEEAKWKDSAPYNVEYNLFTARSLIQSIESLLFTKAF